MILVADSSALIALSVCDSLDLLDQLFMPRQPRFVLIGHPQHVIIRGNNREPIFYTDQDYQFYMDKLKQACDKHDCDVHAYVLMTNHVHLLITPHKENSISKAMKIDEITLIILSPSFHAKVSTA